MLFEKGSGWLCLPLYDIIWILGLLPANFWLIRTSLSWLVREIHLACQSQEHERNTPHVRREGEMKAMKTNRMPWEELRTDLRKSRSGHLHSALVRRVYLQVMAVGAVEAQETAAWEPCVVTWPRPLNAWLTKNNSSMCGSYCGQSSL